MSNDTDAAAGVVLDPGTPGQTERVLVDRVFVGRECAGVDETRRILVTDDPAVSRNHLEVRIDSETSTVVAIDTSSNGTRINGIRIERSVPIPLRDGDRISIGSHVLEFHARPVSVRPELSLGRGTVALEAPAKMALLAGDLINYSTVSEQTDQLVLARDIDRLYRALRELLSEHRGTLIDYVGDAFFATWELEVDESAPALALEFALAAADCVAALAPQLTVGYADGSPLRMGWGVTMGDVVLRMMPGSVIMAIGDVVNLAFRLSALAGREGRPNILATESVRQSAGERFRFGAPEQITVKGRVTVETLYGVDRI